MCGHVTCDRGDFDSRIGDVWTYKRVVNLVIVSWAYGDRHTMVSDTSVP